MSESQVSPIKLFASEGESLFFLEIVFFYLLLSFERKRAHGLTQENLCSLIQSVLLKILAKLTKCP